MDGLTLKSQKALDHELTHRKGRSEPNNLRDQIAVREGLRMWPTPRATDGSNGGPHQSSHGRPDGLSSAAHLWPTPSSRDWKDTPGMARTGVNPDGSKRTRNDQLARRVYQVGAQNFAPLRGTLNPSWVAWLMGFPTGWLDSVHWGTRSSRRSSRSLER